MSRVRGIVALVAIGTGLAALCPGGALAGDIAVTVSGDDFTVNGNCTLREAVQAANTNAAVDACPDPGDMSSADTVILDSDTYVIGIPPDGTPNDNLDGDFDIDTGMAAGDLTIQGEGRLVTEIDAEDVDRVLHLSSGGGTLTVDAASVRNGQVPGSAFADRGGGIFAQAGALSLVDAEVTSNETNAEGGGIAVAFNGSMTWFDSIISGNQSHGGTGGGGVNWQPGSATPTLTLQGTVVTNNEATTAVAATQMFGGGISSFGKLTVNSGVISGNYALGTGDTRGGGVFHNGPNGAATFRGTAISGNSARNSAGATTNGGGIAFQNQPAGNGIAVDLERSTLSGNYLDNTAGGMQQGGGAWGLNPSRMRVVNSTVSGNMALDAGGDGGGIEEIGVQLDIYHSTFAENQAADQADAVNLSAAQADTLANSIIAEGAGACGGAFFTSAGGNVDAGSSCWSSDVTGDVQSQPAQLGPLAQNAAAGLPFTHALGLTSPARDRVPLAACVDDVGAPLTIDSRGVPRPFPAGGACDSGSYELIVCDGVPFNPVGPFTACPLPPPPPGVSPPTGKKKKKCKKKKKGKAGTSAAKKRKCKKKKK